LRSPGQYLYFKSFIVHLKFTLLAECADKIISFIADCCLFLIALLVFDAG